ncbi:hypothetical protein GCM10023096_46980 [Nonomuraea ferruginea]
MCNVTAASVPAYRVGVVRPLRSTRLAGSRTLEGGRDPAKKMSGFTARERNTCKPPVHAEAQTP